MAWPSESMAKAGGAEAEVAAVAAGGARGLGGGVLGIAAQRRGRHEGKGGARLESVTRRGRGGPLGQRKKRGKHPDS